MREIEEPGDVPQRVVGDNAASEHGIQEGDAAVLLRARTSSAVACRYALLTASRNWSIRYQKVVATFLLGLLPMLAGHRDHIQKDVPQRSKADREGALHARADQRNMRVMNASTASPIAAPPRTSSGRCAPT